MAFVDLDEQGRSGLFVQDFMPGADTSRTRRRLTGFDTDILVESFGFSPDGTRLAVSIKERSSDLLLAEGLAGVVQAAR